MKSTHKIEPIIEENQLTGWHVTAYCRGKDGKVGTIALEFSAITPSLDWDISPQAYIAQTIEQALRVIMSHQKEDGQK